MPQSVDVEPKLGQVQAVLETTARYLRAFEGQFRQDHGFDSKFLGQIVRNELATERGRLRLRPAISTTIGNDEFDVEVTRDDENPNPLSIVLTDALVTRKLGLHYRDEEFTQLGRMSLHHLGEDTSPVAAEFDRQGRIAYLGFDPHPMIFEYSNDSLTKWTSTKWNEIAKDQVIYENGVPIQTYRSYGKFFNLSSLPNIDPLPDIEKFPRQFFGVLLG